MREDAVDPMNWFDEQDIEAMYDRPISSLDTVLQNDPDWFTKGGEVSDRDDSTEPGEIELDEEEDVLAEELPESARWREY